MPHAPIPALSRRTLMLGALAAAAAGSARAQGGWPSKPVRWIVGYPAGGGTDYLARTIGAQMATQLGQQVVVDNRAGAAAIIGADAAAHAPADGYTVFTADNGVLVYNPALYKKLPYDPARDFASVGLMARAPLLIAAAPSAGIRDAADLLARLKKNPGKLNYASPGNGSPHHLAMELFKHATGTFAVHVPYRGAAPALQDVMAGQVPLMMVDTSSAMPAIKSGKLQALVMLSGKRIAQLPDVPTMVEMGYKEVEAYAWQGLVVPAATPKDVVQRLSGEMQAALANADVRKKLFEAAWEPVPSDATLMSVYTQAETRKWHKLIRERNIVLEG